MKSYVQQPEPMTTYDAPAPYGKRQLALRDLIETEAEMLEQFKHRLDAMTELSFGNEIERRQAFIDTLVLIEQKLWGR